MRILVWIGVVALAGVAAAHPQAGTRQVGTPPDKQGFVSLFNGKDLGGWQSAPGSRWVVEDGSLTLKDRSDAQEHNLEYLWTEQTYGDFIVELEFKVPERANSGIFLRTADLKDPVYSGVEIQVCNSYGRQELSRGGTAGAVYDCLAPTKNSVNKPGEWNHCQITCQGSKILVVLNGQPVIDMDLDRWTEPNKNPDGSQNKFPRALKDFARRGYVGLQDHGLPVWYRNVSIKPLEGGEAAFTLLPDPHGMVLKTPQGQTVFRYMTKKPEVTKLSANSVCCLFPVNAPSGERVVDFAPSDHPHHRGVFLAWHSLKGKQKADFWGWGEWAPTEGRVIRSRGLKLLQSDAKQATLEVRNDWTVEDEVMIEEVTLLTTRQQGPAYVIDLDYRLTPKEDVTLDQTAFGGFCVKCRKDGKSVYTSPKGEVTLSPPHHLKPETDWPAADWYDYTVRLDSGKTVGIAVLDHPDNPPTTWHNLAPISMVNPCIVARGPVVIKQGQPLRLRYRLVVHDGPAPVTLLKGLAGEWRKR